MRPGLIVLELIICLSFSALTFADTIVLKSGKNIEGKIIEKTDEYVKIDFQGVELTYFMDEIDQINNTDNSSETNGDIISKSSPSASADKVIYYSKEHGLKLTVPSGWQVYDNKDPIKMLKAMPGIEILEGRICVIKKQLSDVNPSVFLSYEPLGTEHSIEELNEDSKRSNLINEKQTPQYYQIIENSNIITLNGKQFSKSITRSQDPSGKYGDETGLSYYFVRGAISYSLICSSESQQFDSYKDLFEKTAASIEFETNDTETAVEHYGQSKEAGLTSESAGVKQDKVAESETYYSKGIACGKSGDHLGAISNLSKAIDLNPDYVEAYDMRGKAYSVVYNTAQALSDFNKTVEINPKFDDGYVNIGGVYLASGQYQKALTYFQKAIAINPNNAAAYSNLGVAYRYLGNPEEAISNCKKALAIDPNHEMVNYNLGSFYSLLLKQYEQAIPYYEKTVEVNPENAKAYVNLGICYAYSKQPEKADENLQKGRELYIRKGDIEGIQKTDSWIKFIKNNFTCPKE